jgi:membrane associated rhomboid family serine protease
MSKTQQKIACPHLTTGRIGVQVNVPSSSFPHPMKNWEGDDLRWSRRLQRRLQRQYGRGEGTPAKNTLMVLFTLMFLYQTSVTVDFLKRGHPGYWPKYALSMIGDALLGSSIRGPLTTNFGFSSMLARNQPHRFLTSGLVHGGILPLVVNFDVLRRQPSWLETGLGIPLYLTTFFVSIVTGNLGHLSWASDPYSRTLALGASGGICGLYGLMYTSLLKMGNARSASQIAKGMGILLASGLLFDTISNASHAGGFLGGMLMAALCGPSYGKSYNLRRKNSIADDPYPRDYRQAMGFGITPNRGMLPLGLVWGVLVALFMVAKPKFRAMPSLVLKGFLYP